MPPVSPMLAKLTRELPEADGLFYEPKWDGFRCIVFRDGDDVVLGSRNEKPLTRYFPELVESLLANVPDRCVLDGEIVIAGPSGLDFDALSQRIHPGRVTGRAVSQSHAGVVRGLRPAGRWAIATSGPSPTPSGARPWRGRLKQAKPPIHLTPVTTDPEVARDWFSRFEGAGLDGVVVKAGDLPYQPDKRVMMKVKHERTADCVVGGFRWHKEGGVVGSLLLGLFDEAGVLHHVGVASGFSAARREEFVDDTRAVPRERRAAGIPGYIEGRPPGRVPGGQSRWSAGKDLSWEPLRPELVVEVAYDHLQGDRFRHATSFVRWRPDRNPASCTYSQLDTPVPTELEDVFGTEALSAGRHPDRLSPPPARRVPGPESAGTPLRTPRSAPATRSAPTLSSSVGSIRRVARISEQARPAPVPRRALPPAWPHHGPSRRTSGSQSAASSGTWSKCPVVGEHDRCRSAYPIRPAPETRRRSRRPVPANRGWSEGRPRTWPIRRPRRSPFRSGGRVGRSRSPTTHWARSLSGVQMITCCDGRVLGGHRGCRSEGVVGLELDHRPQGDAQGVECRFEDRELGPQLGSDAGAGLVAGPEIVAEGLDDMVGGHADMGGPVGRACPPR